MMVMVEGPVKAYLSNSFKAAAEFLRAKVLK
jgi:hypothetical protein